MNLAWLALLHHHKFQQLTQADPASPREALGPLERSIEQDIFPSELLGSYHTLDCQSKESRIPSVHTRSPSNTSYLAVVDSNTADNSPWSNEIECCFQGRTQSHYLDHNICSSAVRDLLDSVLHAFLILHEI